MLSKYADDLVGQRRIEQVLGVLLGVREARRPDRSGCAARRRTSVRRSSTSSPSKAQNAPCLPSYGLPTLPATTNRWPPATPVDLDVRVAGTRRGASARSEHRCELVVGRQPRDELVVRSAALRGRTSRRRRRRSSTVERPAPPPAARRSGPSSRSAPGAAVRLAVLEDVAVGIPAHEPNPAGRSRRAGRGRLDGIGPATRSPPLTMRSASASRGSASTASSAGRLP